MTEEQTPSEEQASERPTDQEIEDKKQSELEAERDERRKRLGHHPYDKE